MEIEYGGVVVNSASGSHYYGGVQDKAVHRSTPLASRGRSYETTSPALPRPSSASLHPELEAMFRDNHRELDKLKRERQRMRDAERQLWDDVRATLARWR